MWSVSPSCHSDPAVAAPFWRVAVGSAPATARAVSELAPARFEVGEEELGAVFRSR
jgi:hypothetical protein